MATANPTRRTDLIVAEMLDQSVVYNSAEEVIHVLNATAKVIWALCDGEHSAPQMVEALSAKFALPADRDVLTDVTAVLRVFSDKGLLLGPEPAQGDGSTQ